MFLNRNQIRSHLPVKKQREFYRRVFSSPVGVKVLTDILIDLCWFDENEDEDKVSREEKDYLRNYANKLLRKIGIIDSQNVEQVVSSLMKMPVRNN